jgi:hypothetical protein
MNRTPFFEEAKNSIKWFPMDKNYILKEVQLSLRDELLQWMVCYTREYYQLAYNPLGLVDDTISTVKSADFSNLRLLYPVYAKIAAVYRHTHGEVQLEFLFNGDEHFDKYEEEWQESYKRWINDLFEHKVFLRAIMEITIFNFHSEHQLLLINNRLQSHLEHFFNLRIYRYKGIIETQVA